MKDGKDKINGYALSRQWFDFVFETTEAVRPIHTALYFWIMELNNQLQWKEVFGLPTKHSMRAINVSGYQHYKKALDDLIRWGFIDLIAKSQNQHTCNQIKINLLHTLSTKQGHTLSTKQGHHSKTLIKTYISNTPNFLNEDAR